MNTSSGQNGNPIKSLTGFAKAYNLAPGQQTTLSFPVTASDLRLVPPTPFIPLSHIHLSLCSTHSSIYPIFLSIPPFVFLFLIFIISTVNGDGQHQAVKGIWRLRIDDSEMQIRVI